VFGALSSVQSSADAVPEIVTDRPDVTESSIVVPKGSLQFENGTPLNIDHGTQDFDASETLLRCGVFSRTEVRIIVPNYLGGISPANSTLGFGDMALGIKQQLGPLPGGFDLSVIAAVSLSTGASRVSSHGFDLFIKFPWSRDLKTGWSIGGMQSLFWNTDGARRNGLWEPTFSLEKEITKPWDAFVEYAGDYRQHGGPREIAHFGTAYRITPKPQVDFHFGFGLSWDAPSRFFALGYSFRIESVYDP
jgi:hypothetical protein